MLQSHGLIDLKGVDQDKVLKLFQLANHLKNGKQELVAPRWKAALAFFEASTRTRMSFELACAQSGFFPVLIDSKENSSLSKGETPLDTLENIAAMNPHILIVRSGAELNFAELPATISCPVINAGWGSYGHPTQALLDIFTLWENQPRFEREKIVIIGDIDHSRVAASHKELAPILGYELKFCGPEQWTKTVPENQRTSLKEAFATATTLMFLRVQKERHAGTADTEQYIENYGFNRDRWSWLKPDQKIMHPGPVNYGVEIDEATARHPQSVILAQVKNGVYIRQALLEQAKDLF